MRVLKNAHYRVLGSEVCRALPRDAFGVPVPRFFCAICSRRLRQALSPRCCRNGDPFRVMSQYQVMLLNTAFKFLTWHCETTRERGPRAETLVPRGDERGSSRWLQAAMRNRSTGE